MTTHQQQWVLAIGSLVFAGAMFFGVRMTMKDAKKKAQRQNGSQAASVSGAGENTAPDKSGASNAPKPPKPKESATVVDPDSADPFRADYIDYVEAIVGKNYLKLVEEKVSEYARQINEAWGGIFPDDEDAVYDAFKSLSDKVQVWQVAQYYGAHFDKVPLRKDLADRLSASELGIVDGIIKKLENYRT